jgi:hypothetical protein
VGVADCLWGARELSAGRGRLSEIASRTSSSALRKTDCPSWTRGPFALTRTVRHSSTDHPQTLCTENPLTKWIERKSSRTHDEHEEQSGYQAPHGRSTKCKIAQPKNILNPPIDGSPKLLGVLRRNFGEMMSTVKARYTPKHLSL